MNKLVLLYSALRHPAGRSGGGVAVAPKAMTSPPLSERPAHGHNQVLTCAWRVDPETGRLGCVWSSSSV
jgi:hypothetical protein